MEVQIPLLVDLDGSLIRTDTLHESAILLLKNKPWLVFHLLYWLLLGKHILKQKLALYTDLKMETLPVNAAVIEFLAEEKAKGRQLILCTGSWVSLAQRFAEINPLFDSIIATNENGNVTGKNKHKIALDRFGKQGFDYLGNEKKDLIVWRDARRAIIVGSDDLVRQATPVVEVERSFATPKVSFKTLLKAARVHQWAKNVLLFVPLIVAHKVNELHSVIETMIAFLSFGLCASATYIFNDLFDLEADRKHLTKSKRALAAGDLPIVAGLKLMSILMMLGILLAYSLNGYFVFSLFVYLVITVLYSFKLKKMHTVDVVVLAGLFTIRVIAGGAAILVSLSFWLLSFSMFIFLSLAIVKRVSELLRTVDVLGNDDESDKKISGRGYYVSDITILQSLGGSAGFLAVLVLAFYINSTDVVQLYHYPQILWLICPVIGYWVMRIWMMTARGEMNEDPISFAIFDKNSWMAGFVILTLLALATVL